MEVEGYLVTEDGEMYFEPLGSREAAAGFLVTLNFDDEVMNCLREMEHPRGMLWSTYRSGEFVEFVSFGSYLNLDRDGSEPPTGCWASSG